MLYHGSWSKWSAAIEAQGFSEESFPFDWRDVSEVFEAHRTVGREPPFLKAFLGEHYPRERPHRSLFFSANFYRARAYATDGGGEIIRLTIEEAENFERLCTDSVVRSGLIEHWQRGLALNPSHAPTKSAVSTLTNDDMMERLLFRVREAKSRLAKLTDGGYPVVFAVRVDPDWFGRRSADHLMFWELGDRHDLDCSPRSIAVDRIWGVARYPKGTDPDFLGLVYTWEEVSRY